MRNFTTYEPETCKDACANDEVCCIASFGENLCWMFSSCAEKIEVGIPLQTWVTAVPHVFVPCHGNPASLTKTQCMTNETYQAIIDSVQAQYKAVDDRKCRMGGHRCAQADWAGCVLRMAGHDMMDHKDGWGGSDACVDMSDGDNGGLAECLIRGESGQSIQMSYEQFCDSVSLADFLVIAAEAVMDITRKQATDQLVGMPFIDNFKFGRETKTPMTCRYEKHRLPNPRLGCEELDRVFVDNMGLNKRETVALLGVHTLGKAEPRFSGFDGWWSDAANSRKFNNNYYISIIAKGWEPVALNNGEFQWNRSDMRKWVKNEMMLDTDMCLAFGDAKGNSLHTYPPESDRCCGYVHSRHQRDGNMSEVVRLNRGDYCGQAWNGPLSPRDEHANCCQLTMPNNTWQMRSCGKRSDFPQGGWDTASVIEFSANETVWLDEFMLAWNKATELGAVGLTSLQETC